MSMDTTLLIYILLGLNVLTLTWIIFLHVRIHTIFKGPTGNSIEGVLKTLKSELETLHTFRKESEQYFLSVEKRLNRAIQSVETIRFNPFKGTGEGGNQSFSTSFINQKGDGVVVSSLYSRDRVSVFAKPIQNFKSTFELTGEEKEVVDAAQRKVKE
jgi:hypothetical protein